MYDACGGQNRSLEAREVELQMVVSHSVGYGNWTQLLCKSSKALNYWPISPDFPILVLICISKMITNTDLEAEKFLVS